MAQIRECAARREVLVHNGKPQFDRPETGERGHLDLSRTGVP